MKIYEYRYEAHVHTTTERDRMEILGREGWRFVAFIEHWAPYDGRTMLFVRETEIS